MSDAADRYDRNKRFFGADGQARLAETRVVVAGVGGLGSALVQHLALLGVGKIIGIEPDELDDTSRNRFIGALESDSVPGSLKIEIVARYVASINSSVHFRKISKSIVSTDAFEAVKASDWVFGCFDDDGPRSVLNELCVAYDKPYMDLASDVTEGTQYGGRVFLSRAGNGCLHCSDLLDAVDVRHFFMSKEERDREDLVYGVDRALLGAVGPSVAPLNGVIASAAAMEFMVDVTGLRPAVRHLEYRGNTSRLFMIKDSPFDGCPICSFRGQADVFDVDRFLRVPHLTA